MTGILLGLFSAAFYGAADFFGGIAARRTSTLSVALGSQAIGLVLLALALPFFPAEAQGRDFLFGLLAGLSGGVGLVFLYMA